MPIQQLTPRQSIERHLMDELRKKEQALIYYLAYIGETVVNIARETRGYTDRTGNLVSSIGYVLVKDGKTIENPQFSQAMEGAEGVQEGEQYAIQKAAELIPNGIGIVVVAGMEYASYVEATGRNVLTKSEIEAKSMAKVMAQKLGIT